MPGVWRVTPLKDTFDLTVKRQGPLHLRVTRAQVPIAPLNAGTFNNAQGKTIKGVGHTHLSYEAGFFL